MKEFYLWLQSEVKCHDLNAGLYHSNLSEFKDVTSVLKDIEIYALEILEHLRHQDNKSRLDALNISIETLRDTKTHASFNPNTQSIVINRDWLDYLKNHMSENDAYEFCRSHELSHALEFDYFKNLKRKARNQACEVLAKRVSQLSINAPYHPSIYEYKYGLDSMHYTKTDLINYIKGEVSCDL